ncbi:MAG: hypothetical protein OXU20_01365 [Myxococcales bacterium]|nr:hypothetical protein [Myxococcales bacterium]
MGRSAADRRSVGRASAPVTMPAPEPSRPVTSGQTGPVQDHGPFPGPFLDTDCGIITFETEPAFERQAGNLLLIVDRAMAEAQRHRAPIWRTARDVLRAEVRRISAGLQSASTVLFPANSEVASTTCGDEDAGCEPPDAGTDADTCRVTGADGSADDMLQLLGRADGGSALEPGESEQRPLLAALLTADKLLTTMDLGVPTTVIIMSAGDPSCDWERERAVAIVDGWRTHGVTTHALAWLGGATHLAPDLRELAAAGGGRFESIPRATPPEADAPLDRLFLTSVTHEILATAFAPTGPLSCTLQLLPEALFPEMLAMTTRPPGSGRLRVPRELGWRLTADGGWVQMDPALCEAVEDGRLVDVEMIYTCPDHPPIPPIRSL